jgi:hypothetical protein
MLRGVEVFFLLIKFEEREKWMKFILYKKNTLICGFVC